MPQYAFLGHLRINGRVTLSTHTHSFTWSRICVELSSAVFKICDQWSVDVSSILRSEFHCMQSVICRLQSVVCSLQSANVRHRVRSPRRSFFPRIFSSESLENSSKKMFPFNFQVSGNNCDFVDQKVASCYVHTLRLPWATVASFGSRAVRKVTQNF